jgi:hypothetical protein
MVTSQLNGAPTSNRWQFDVATGAAASEVVLIPDIRICSATSEPKAIAAYRSHDFLTYVAAATRLSFRGSSGINDATDRLLDVSVLVATAPTEGSSGQHSAVF